MVFPGLHLTTLTYIFNRSKRSKVFKGLKSNESEMSELRHGNKQRKLLRAAAKDRDKARVYSKAREVHKNLQNDDKDENQ
jgi:hypothetical protein